MTFRNPDLYTVSQIKKWTAYELQSTGTYLPTRPLPFYGITLRTIKLAWGVLIGKYDALDWSKS